MDRYLSQNATKDALTLHCGSSSDWLSCGDLLMDVLQLEEHQRGLGKSEPLFTAVAFTKRVYCQSCQSASRSQSSLEDRKKNLYSSNIRIKKKSLHELWLIFFTGGKPVNSLKKRKKKSKILLLLWTLESSFREICFFLVTDWDFFFTGKKYAYWWEKLNASPF